ncbi:MAG TPA: hypothetical protein RMH99_09350 [Sandaracinaceae bacterium LLY-WYZ-13_1]|nr:hypothetical protein [Sandaracinaceae bacterium LLY-WYZ-13_1]
MSDWFDAPKARLRLRDDGIAEIRHDPGVLYTEALAMAHVEAFREWLDGRRVPLLVVVGEGFRPDDRARAFLLHGDLVGDTFTRGAILFARRVEAMAVDLFLRIQRPVRPMKAFTRESDALSWLRAG